MAMALLSSCTSSPEGEAATTGEATETATATAEAKSLTADVSASSISWEGTKPGGSHVGNIGIKSGSLSVKDGNIEAGEFVLDMGSITCTDEGMDDGTKAKLVGHLSAPDFFDVAKYPEAQFVIAEVNALEGVEGMTHSIKGNLTMKEKTQSVTFNANVTANENGVTAESNAFTIDRNQWGVSYGSTLVGALKDEAISDNIGLTIKLVAK